MLLVVLMANTVPTNEVRQEQPIQIEVEEKYQEAEVAPNQGFVEYPCVYLDSYTGQNADHLLASGRHIYFYGDTEFPASDTYKHDAFIKYCIYKCMTWTNLSGFPNSPFCDYEYAKYFVMTCIANGREWETALAIAGMESTYGLTTRNYFGILDNRFDDGSVEGYCGYLDWYEMQWNQHICNDLPCIINVYNEHAKWHENFYELVQGIKGEMY